jgi:hypothetical protein
MFFYYRDLIAKSNREEAYFDATAIFIDVLTLMYKYDP